MRWILLFSCGTFAAWCFGVAVMFSKGHDASGNTSLHKHLVHYYEPVAPLAARFNVHIDLSQAVDVLKAVTPCALNVDLKVWKWLVVDICVKISNSERPEGADNLTQKNGTAATKTLLLMLDYMMLLQSCLSLADCFCIFWLSIKTHQ